MLEEILEDFRSWAFKNDFLNKGKWVKKSLDMITKSYEAGKETGKEDAVDEFMKPAGMKFFAKCVDTINERIRENARKQERSRLLEEVEKLIVDEMLICHKEGTPTSRLTSLNTKINQILKI